MMVDVHLYGGTVMRFAGRHSLITLLRRDPETIDEARALRAWIDRGQRDGFQPARLQYVKKTTIAWIEQIHGEERDRWLAEHAPDVLAQIREKEAPDTPPITAEAA